MFVKLASDYPIPRPKKDLTRDRIIEAALGLVDREGLAALSARKVAAQLGCKPMSLYNYVGSMDDIEDGIVDLLLGSIVQHPRSLDDLTTAATAYLTLAHRHSEAFVLVATRVWRGPNALAAAKAFVAFFMKIGLPEDESLRRARILGAYLNGSGLALGASRKRQDPPAPAEGGVQVAEDLQAGLVRLIAMLSDASPKKKAAQ